jgi:hypothetical protein
MSKAALNMGIKILFNALQPPVLFSVPIIPAGCARARADRNAQAHLSRKRWRQSCPSSCTGDEDHLVMEDMMARNGPGNKTCV